MAIFRAGKRLGPFDIRGGISRGDFKSSAYSKTDRDPRFKQQANPENTIGRFRAAMASAEGFARPNRFAVRIFPPSNLHQLIANQQETTSADGVTYDNEMYNGTGQVNGLVDGGVMNSLTQTIGRQLNIMCDSVTMPGVDLTSQEVQYGSEPVRNFVTGHQFSGNINATFYALECMDAPTVWIVGGVDKGNDYLDLMPLVREKVKAIICLGVENSKIIHAFDDVVDLLIETTSAEEAVRMAYRLTGRGDTVLLSPACASFDLFESYEDRGRQFKNAVRAL